MYDLVHPDDVEKVREQLSTTESQNTGRILDLKSKLIVTENTENIATAQNRCINSGYNFNYFFLNFKYINVFVSNVEHEYEAIKNMYGTELSIFKEKKYQLFGIAISSIFFFFFLIGYVGE